jgi:DNA-binding transcriptional ArsR family regulator
LSQAGVKLRDGKLPADLAAALDPGLRQCLESPARREIVRTLNRVGQPLAIRNLATELPSYTVSEIGYHVRVLERAGGLKFDDDAAQGGGDHRRYISDIGENTEALSALRATQQWDLEDRRTRRRRASRVPTMFRIPRPTQTIRLGKRGRSES